MHTNIEQNSITAILINRKESEFGQKISLLGKIFGCWHKDLTRPFTLERTTYRACLSCGARQPFDAVNLKTFGSFYFPPAAALRKH